MKVTCFLRKELQIDSLKLTDGQVVLAYIWSNYKQFKVFVANHIHQIKKMQGLISSTMPQAMKILLMMLHKDLIQGLETSNSHWVYGLSFLWQVEALWSNKDCNIEPLEDQELKREAKTSTV